MNTQDYKNAARKLRAETALLKAHRLAFSIKSARSDAKKYNALVMAYALTNSFVDAMKRRDLKFQKFIQKLIK